MGKNKDIQLWLRGEKYKTMWKFLKNKIGEECLAKGLSKSNYINNTKLLQKIIEKVFNSYSEKKNEAKIKIKELQLELLKDKIGLMEEVE